MAVAGERAKLGEAEELFQHAQQDLEEAKSKVCDSLVVKEPVEAAFVCVCM